MKTFLSKIPQAIDFTSLVEFDPSLDTSIRDVAQSVGMPATNGLSLIADAQAAIFTAQMLHDGEDKDAFRKGVIKGLMLACALPKLCSDFVNSTKQEGKPK